MSKRMIEYKVEDGKIKTIDGYEVGADIPEVQTIKFQNKALYSLTLSTLNQNVEVGLGQVVTGFVETGVSNNVKVISMQFATTGSLIGKITFKSGTAEFIVNSIIPRTDGWSAARVELICTTAGTTETTAAQSDRTGYGDLYIHTAYIE